MLNAAKWPESYVESSLFKFPEIGVHALYGPNWASDLEKIKTELGEEAA